MSKLRSKLSRKNKKMSVSKLHDSQNSIMISLAGILIVVIGLMYIVPYKGNDANKSSNGTNNTVTASKASAKLYINPSGQNLEVGDTFKFDIYVESPDEFNGIQANLSYPTNLFEFENIDDSTTNWDAKLQSEGGNGTIKIARGTFSKASGMQKVATVNLKVIAKGNNANVEFLSSSIITQIKTADNILGQMTGASFNIL